MNTTIKHGLIEIHDFSKGDVPIILYPDMTKYKNVPFKINKHSDIELLFVKNGKIEMHLDDGIYHASKNEIIVANANVLHNIIPLTESVSYDCMIIDKAFCRHYGFDTEKHHIQEIIDNPLLFNQIERIKTAATKQNHPFKVAEITAEILKILLVLFQNYEKSIDEADDPRSKIMLERGIAYIHEHFQEQIDIDDIASYAGYSKYYFCHKFKETTGCTVNTYLNMQRISYAKEQFSSGLKNISKVAADSGFNNIAYFSKIFKKFVTLSPTEYIKKLNKAI